MVIILFYIAKHAEIGPCFYRDAIIPVFWRGFYCFMKHAPHINQAANVNDSNLSTNFHCNRQSHKFAGCFHASEQQPCSLDAMRCTMIRRHGSFTRSGPCHNRHVELAFNSVLSFLQHFEVRLVTLKITAVMHLSPNQIQQWHKAFAADDHPSG